MTKQISKKICKENWKTLPYTSEHLWKVDIHGIPTGKCVKCGKGVEDWDKELDERVFSGLPKAKPETKVHKKLRRKIVRCLTEPDKKGIWESSSQDWEKELAENQFSMWGSWDRRESHIKKREAGLKSFISRLLDLKEREVDQRWEERRTKWAFKTVDEINKAKREVVERIREWVNGTGFTDDGGNDAIYIDEFLDFLKTEYKVKV